MKTIDEIPDSWETTDEHVVTVNPHTGEVEENLSSTGAGPHVDQVRGTVMKRPCPDCEDAMMRLLAPEGILECEECFNTALPSIEENEPAE